MNTSQAAKAGRLQHSICRSLIAFVSARKIKRIDGFFHFLVSAFTEESLNNTLPAAGVSPVSPFSTFREDLNPRSSTRSRAVSALHLQVADSFRVCEEKYAPAAGVSPDSYFSDLSEDGFFYNRNSTGAAIPLAWSLTYISWDHGIPTSLK